MSAGIGGQVGGLALDHWALARRAESESTSAPRPYRLRIATIRFECLMISPVRSAVTGIVILLFLIGNAEYANADGASLPVAVADVRADGDVSLGRGFHETAYCWKPALTNSDESLWISGFHPMSQGGR